MAENPFMKDRWVPAQPQPAPSPTREGAPNPFMQDMAALQDQAQTGMVGQLGDIGYQGFAGAMEGLLKSPGTMFGDFPMWLGNVGRKGYDRIMRLNAEDKGRPAPKPTALSDEELAEEMRTNPIGSQSVRAMWRNQVGINDPTPPQTTAGRYARTAGEFLGGSIPMGGADTVRAGVGTVLGGLAFQGARDAFPESDVIPIAASLLASQAPSAVSAGGWAMVPNMTPKQAAQARYLMSQGVPVYPGQAASNSMVRNLYDMARKTSLFGNDAAERQATAFTRAAARTMGANTDDITQGVLNSSQRRIAGNLERLYRQTSVVDDGILQPELAAIDAQARRALQPAEYGYIRSALDEISDALTSNPQGVPGDVYWNMVKHNSKSALNNALGNQSPNISGFARDIRNVLEDALDRQAPPQFRPELTQAKRQYSNFKILERPAQTSGTDDISPGGLLNRVVNQTGRVTGDLGRLGKAGKNILKPVPSSGTAERLIGAGLMSSAGGAVGGLAMGSAGLPALGSAALAAGLPMGARSILESRWLMNRMLQKAANRAGAMRGGPPAAAGAPTVSTGVQAVGALQRPQFYVTPGLLSY